MFLQKLNFFKFIFQVFIVSIESHQKLIWVVIHEKSVKLSMSQTI